MEPTTLAAADPASTASHRRRLRSVLAALVESKLAVVAGDLSLKGNGRKQPNVMLVFGDQWRAQAFGYAGDPNVRTPHIDQLAARSVSLENAVSGCPVCCPMRASLLTGQAPVTHGVFLNDVYLRDDGNSLAQAFARGGYKTAYIGKWHVDGHGRSSYIPPERRQGFQYWKTLECTHNYMESHYFAHESGDEKLTWHGYDAFAQTDDAEAYLRSHAASSDDPFLLMLSWGPPHNPYHTAPDPYANMYDPGAIQLRENVPADIADSARRDLAGYYAHCTALDDCVGQLCSTLDETGLLDDTLLVFFSDHGDMLGSQGQIRKQRPYDEAIRVPFLVSCPSLLGARGARAFAPLDVGLDMLPTILDLCGLPCPPNVQGKSFGPYIQAAADEGRHENEDSTLVAARDPSGGAALLQCAAPFGEWTRKQGGREYRGLRTRTHTYVRTLVDGAWMLFDNVEDPYQLHNRIGDSTHADLVREFDDMLVHKLAGVGDKFEAASALIETWGYTVDPNTGTVPYTN